MLAETMQEAIDTIRPAINAYYEFLGGSRPAGEWTKRGYLDIGEEMTPEDDKMDWFDFLNKRGIIVVGDADYVADRFAEKARNYWLRSFNAYAAIYWSSIRENSCELETFIRKCSTTFWNSIYSSKEGRY